MSTAPEAEVEESNEELQCRCGRSGSRCCLEDASTPLHNGAKQLRRESADRSEHKEGRLDAEAASQHFLASQPANHLASHLVSEPAQQASQLDSEASNQ